MKNIKFAICGAGLRGTMLARDVICTLQDVEISGISDPYPDKAETLADIIKEKKGYRPKVYANCIDMFNTGNFDAAVVATSWESHIPVAIDAMNRGIAVAMEVGGAYNEKECRELIAAYERTHTPFMFMENCCFGKDELLITAMVRAGILGEIVYCHGAYMHDLRSEVAFGELERHYRIKEYSSRNRDNYPTHALGPIAKILNINRGNRMVSLSSRASKARGLNEYAKKKEKVSYLAEHEFSQGDVVETIITCENGELINLRLDTTLPVYYSREFNVHGTRGLYEQTPNMVILEDNEHREKYSVDMLRECINNAEDYYDKYLPEMWKKMTPEMIEAGHGGMDIFEFQVFCDCLRNGKKMPIDVYDAAAWMSIAYLTERSIVSGGNSIEIPDFTNGAYKTRIPEDVISFESEQFYI